MKRGTSEARGAPAILPGPYHEHYERLSPGDFESLLYELFLYRAQSDALFDRVTWSPEGKDRGRDIWLHLGERPTGVVQCKRLQRSVTAPQALHEIVKFLLFAELDPGLCPEPAGFLYALALTKAPAQTTAELFVRPAAWLAEHPEKLERSVREVISTYRALNGVGVAEATRRMGQHIPALRREIIGPSDLDRLIHEAPASLGERFFGHRLVIDADLAVELARTLSPPEASGNSLTEAELAILASEVSLLVADKLDAVGIYKRGKTVDRKEFEREVRAFVRSRQQILPVLGRSGVGKSSAMAALAEAADGLPPRLLLLGAEIGGEDAGIEACLARLPWQRAGFEGDGAAAVERLTAGGQKLLVLVDGLNEATCTAERLRNNWIRNTVGWLVRRRNVQLVITCRPEFWDSVADTFPARLIHRGAPKKSSEDPRDRSGNERASPTAASPTGKPPEAKPPLFCRMEDFTRAETAEALAAYGLEDRLTIEQAAHPFLLSLALDLEPAQEEARQDRPADYVSLLDQFVSSRVTGALARVSLPTRKLELIDCLTEIAADMFARRSQTIEPAQAEAKFNNHVVALDAVLQEHLLTRVGRDYRFVHDQVRECLQARAIRAEAILAELPPPRATAASGGWQKIPVLAPLFGPWHKRALYRARRLRDSRERHLQPAVAAVALARIIRDRPEIEWHPILEALFEATALPRTGADAKWATRTTVLLTGYVAPAALDNPLFRRWAERLMGRSEAYWLDNWQEELATAFVSYLIRIPGRFEEKRAFLPLVLLNEHNSSWSTGRMADKVFWEKYSSRTEEPYRAYGSLFKSTAGGRLLTHLVQLDGKETLETLLRLLDDQGGPVPLHRGRSRVPVSHCAATALYQFRSIGLTRVISAALDSAAAEHPATPAALNLLEALALSDPDPVAEACLTRLEAETGEARHVYQRLLWSAGNHHPSEAMGHRIVLYSLTGLKNKQGLDLAWASRILLAQRERHRLWLRLDEKDESAQELLDVLASWGDRAATLLLAHVARNAEEYHLVQDCEYALNESFETAFGIYQQWVASEDGLPSAAAGALFRFLTASHLHERDAAAGEFSRMIALLNVYLDGHGARAANQLAAFAIISADQAGMNELEFSREEVSDLDILPLAIRIIGLGGEAVVRQCDSLRWFSGGEISHRLFEAIVEARREDLDVEELVHSLLDGSRFLGKRAWEYALQLRTAGREQPWDEGARRYLRIAPHRTCPLEDDIVAFWRGLDPSSLTESSAGTLAWLDEGLPISHAASRRVVKGGKLPR